MDLKVIGRHALLFDDDATSAFVNSDDALIEWNALQIDRYDVRHFLSSPPPPRLRHRRNHPPANEEESKLDIERYLDLPPNEELEVEEKAEVDANGYHYVGFSYGDDTQPDEKRSLEEGNECPGFRPPFTVPEFLLKSLPSTEKIHQIISRTALFVSKHGGQTEIILRVKQGDNPTFGFLMPDHQLHPYFRFLVDHPEDLHSAVDANLQDENIENSANKRSDSVGGALSLLGSAYDSGEDEDATEAEQDSNITPNAGGVGSVGSVTSQAVDKSKLSPGALENGEASTKHSLAIQKGKPPLIKKNPSVNTFRAESSTSVKNFDRSSSCPPVTEKLSNYSIGSISRTESLIVEPPSDMKKTVDKIVDFIVKNGKQFETTLIEQDRKHGRFPFLLQSNLYHPYYSSLLQKVQESKQSGKSSICGKDESVVARERKASPSMSNDSATISASDIPFESDNKEKFKMVIGKLKKDGQDRPPKASSQQLGLCVDAEAAAAILQAAARGIKNPEIGMVSSTTLNRKPIDPSSEGHNSIYGNSNLSNSKTSMQKSDQNGRSSSISTAERRSAEATGNSDLSGVQLTKEEELRAARRRRAKMFVSMLKGGASSTAVPVRGSSVEPQASPVLGTGTEDHLPSKAREGNSTGVSEENKILDKKVSNDEHDERRSKRKYRSRSERYDEEDYDEDAVIVEDEVVSDGDEGAHKHSKRRKHRSQHSTRSQKDYESDEEGRSHKHSKSSRRKHDGNGDDSDRSSDRRKHSKRKHRDHHSSEEDHDGNGDDSDRSSDRRKHSKRKHRDHHLSEEDHDGNGDDSDRRGKSSRRKHSSHRSSHEIEEASSDKERERRRKKQHSSRRSRSRHERSHTKRHSTRDKESSPEHKPDSLSENEPLRKIVGKTNSADLEEGEISSKLSDQSRETGGEGRASREASLGVSSSHHTAPPPPSNPPGVSDELRAKIRAMLMATR